MASITTKITKEFNWAKDFRASNLKIGDEITDVLKNGRKITFVILDDGVMGLKNCLGEHVMNPARTNAGGWLASEMRRYLNEDIFPLLPDDLQSIIRPRYFGEETDMLWLFSETEIFGEHDWTEKEPDRGAQLEYFKNPANRIKLDCDGDPCWWWERSPNSSSSTYFCGVNSRGDADHSSASYSYGVCFGFYF